MSLDVRLMVTELYEIYEASITHNLTKMAAEAGLYSVLWRPEGIGFKKAKDIIFSLRRGLKALEADPERFKKISSNGWGTYDGLVTFTRNYLKACIDNPEADIEVSR